ncbi:MAG: hypothetical protein ACRDHI_05665 [Actinomycetota bacterium]
MVVGVGHDQSSPSGFQTVEADPVHERILRSLRAGESINSKAREAGEPRLPPSPLLRARLRRLDPLTGRERRRWHPAGHERSEAEAIASRIDREHEDPRPKTGGPITLGSFLTDTWLPRKRRQVSATTAYRYAWFIERYVNSALGEIPLRRLRLDHLEQLYQQLATTGGRRHDGLAPKTIIEVHMIIRAALSSLPCDASSSTASRVPP